MLDQLIAIIAGILIGFAMAIPIGPVGLIIFQRSIVKSRRLGLATGIGSAITDGFFASIGAFGVHNIWNFIVDQQILFRLGGGLLLLAIGLARVFLKYRPELKKKDGAVSLIEHFISGIILTATNPVTTLSFFVIFASIAPWLGIGSNDFVATALVLGVCIGAFLWWLTLSHIASVLGHRIKPEYIELMNKCFGFIIALIGTVMLLDVIF